MSIWQAIFLGFVQGATEFLPVSSSGHLVLVPWLLHWPEPSVTYDVIVHLGTLVAVTAAFWRDIGHLLAGGWRLLRTRRLVDGEARLVALLALSAVPGALLGYLLDDWFSALFGYPLRVSLLLAITGFLLVLGDRLGRRVRPMTDMSFPDALVLGLAQGCAIAPGISRSGATIAAGLLRGLDRESATRFSFLMSLPIILGATGYKMVQLAMGQGPALLPTHLLAGLAAAAVSGYVAVRLFLHHVRRRSLRRRP